MGVVRSCTLAIFLLLSLPACEPDEPLPDYDAVVVWASYEDEAYFGDLFEEFTKETRVPVLVRHERSELHLYNLLENVGSEPADLFMSRNAADLWQAANEGALRPVQASNLEAVPPVLKDGDNLWTAIGYQASGIGYRSGADATPGSLAKLADEEFHERVCLSTSQLASNLAIVAMLIEQVGSKTAERMVRAWIENLAKAPFRTESSLVEALAKGDCDVALLAGWNQTEMGSGSSGQMTFVRSTPFLNQIEGVGIGRHSRNPQSAQVLVNWLLSEDVNNRHADKVGAYAVRDNAYLNTDGAGASIAGWRHSDAKLLVERAGYR